MINCDGSGTDMFLPMMFQIRKKFGGVEDLFQECFKLILIQATSAGFDNGDLARIIVNHIDVSV